MRDDHRRRNTLVDRVLMDDPTIKLRGGESVTFVSPKSGKTTTSIRLNGNIEIGRIRINGSGTTIEFHSGTDVAVAGQVCDAILSGKHLEGTS